MAKSDASAIWAPKSRNFQGPPPFNAMDLWICPPQNH